jgi:hypothetical protein
MTEQPEHDDDVLDRGQPDAEPEPERADAEGRQVYVTHDEAGVTSLSEQEGAATPRPTDPRQGAGAAERESDAGEASLAREDDGT